MISLIYRHPWFKKHLERHTAFIPKGFLRFYALKLLSEKPMSGSEIMEEIERRTDGHWRPSPGSIYPLLAWLRDKGLVKEVSSEEGVKRYSITEEGKKLLEEEKKFLGLREKFGKPHFFTFLIPFWLSMYSSKMVEIRMHLKDLFKELFLFKKNMEFNFSEKALKELQDALKQFIDKVKTINRKFAGGESKNGDR